MEASRCHQDTIPIDLRSAKPASRSPGATCSPELRRWAVTGAAPSLAGEGAPKGQLTWGVHISLAPTWFDPAETPGSSRRSW